MINFQTDLYYLLYHNAVDAHVLKPSGEVKQVDPGKSLREDQQSDVLLHATGIQHGGGEEHDCLQKTRQQGGIGDNVTFIENKNSMLVYITVLETKLDNLVLWMGG